MVDHWLLLALAAGIVVLEAAVQRRVGLGLADEGYLWYGSVRVAHGDRPMENFRSYDPGRYYWCSVWVRCFGPGILTIRAAASAFFALGLWAGLQVAARATSSWFELALIAAFLTVWAHPRWKRFDHGLSLVSVLAVVWILEGLSVGVVFVAGVFAGVAGYVGRNHGVYLVVAQAAAVLYAWLKLDDEPSAPMIAAWIAGIGLGYSPMIASWVRRRGMFGFYVREKLLVFVERGSMNLKLPIPWPWRFRPAGLRPRRAAADLSHRVLLVAGPIALIAGVASIVFTDAADQQPWFVAVVIVGVTYLHHAFGRADTAHMCQAYLPLVLGVGIAISELTSVFAAIAAWSAAAIVSIITVGPLVPVLERAGAAVPFDSIEVAGQRLALPHAQAEFVTALQRYAESTVAPSDSVFLAPHMPAMYPVLGRTSPTHNTYLIFPETAEKQQQMIDELEHSDVTLAVIGRASLDDRPDLRFDATHPDVWAYLAERFETVDVDGLETCDVFRKIVDRG